MTNAAVSLDVLVGEARRFAKAVTLEDVSKRRKEFGMSQE
jgi:hypothetical protein